MSALRQDLTHAVRVLRTRPVFTLAAVLSLALGVAANSTLFSAMQATAAGPPGIDHADRLLVLSPGPAADPALRAAVSAPGD